MPKVSGRQENGSPSPGVPAPVRCCTMRLEYILSAKTKASWSHPSTCGLELLPVAVVGGKRVSQSGSFVPLL